MIYSEQFLKLYNLKKFLFKGLRPTAGQGPKQRACCSRGSVLVVVVVVVIVVVCPAAAHDADEAPGAARISSIIWAYVGPC